jgi:hypothetical protein
MGEDGGWRPSEADIRWTQNLADGIKEGGRWGTSWGVYKLEESKKLVTLETVVDPKLCYGDQNHNRVKLTFEEMGWKVVDLNKE